MSKKCRLGNDNLGRSCMVLSLVMNNEAGGAITRLRDRVDSHESPFLTTSL